MIVFFLIPMQIHAFLRGAGQCEVSFNETGITVCFLVELGYTHFLSTRLCFTIENRKKLMNLQSQVHLRSVRPRIRNSKSELPGGRTKASV